MAGRLAASGGPGVEPTRLALPVPQRALPRHRRHGDGPARPPADRAWPTTPRSSAATGAGGRLAARDAEPRRRLGGLRRRHRQPGAHQGPLRRPQRDARPELRRHHGADPRDPRHARLPGRPPGRSPAASTTSGGPRSPRGAGTAAGASTTSTGPGRSSRASRRSTSRWTTPPCVRAADWLESVQQADGGWGETCASYDDPSLMGQGEPTASQTAWAVLGLIAAGRAEGEAVRRGVQYLLETQTADGTWDEADLHRDRLPPRLLPEVSPLPGLLPADGPRPATRPPSAGSHGPVASRVPAPCACRDPGDSPGRSTSDGRSRTTIRHRRPIPHRP